jgi:hypothetical protein
MTDKTTKILCSNCDHAQSVGDWIAANVAITRHRIVHCGYKIPPLPKLARSYAANDLFEMEYWSNRRAVDCACWQAKP